MLSTFSSESEWLEIRKNYVTSTEIAALLGVSPFKSRFALWHEKKSGVNDFAENDRMKWGRRLQNVIAAGIAEDQGWQVEDLSLMFLHDEASRVGASMDCKVVCPNRGAGILEIKNVDKMSAAKYWDEDEAPIYYEIQLQTQLHLAQKEGLDIQFGAIGALIGGNEPRLYFREYDPAIGETIEQEARSFWESIENDTPPKPDYSIDGPLLLKLTGPILEGKEVDLSDSNRFQALIAELERIATEADEPKARVKELDEQKKAVQTEIWAMMGDAEIARASGYQIKAAMTTVSEKITKGYSFRNCRVKKLF